MRERKRFLSWFPSVKKIVNWKFLAISSNSFVLLPILSWHSVIYLSFDEVISAVKFLSALELKSQIDFQSAHLNIFQFYSSENRFSQCRFIQFTSPDVKCNKIHTTFLLFLFTRLIYSCSSQSKKPAKAVLNFHMGGWEKM